VLPAAAPTRPCVSDRYWVWQDATLVFALVVGAVEEVACFAALVGVWTLDDSVEVCPWDEVDGAWLDVEEHPVSNDVVIAISPATVENEFFISPTIHQRWEHYTKMTHS
jgi:hypothetical protein